MDKKPYSRRITGLLPKDLKIGNIFSIHTQRYLFFFLTGLFVFLFILASFLFLIYRNVAAARSQEERRLAYWEGILQKHPNFTDAYYKAAVSEVRLNDKEKAMEYIDHALSLDPGFKEAEQLKEKINEQSETSKLK